MGRPAPKPTAQQRVRSGIREAISLLLEPGTVTEIRSPGTRRGTLSGYYDDFDALAGRAAALDGAVPGIYITPNPVRPDLLARAVNRVKPYAKYTTADADVLRRRWLLTDFDPKRPAGISSTDAEHEAAFASAEQCRQWLRASGWPEPVLADSGNGAHLIYRIDLPNDDDARELVKRCLAAIAQQLTTDQVEVDLTTYNAGRIWKLYGTLACKGDSTPGRPHRRASIVEGPRDLLVVPRHRLDRLAASVCKLTQASPRRRRAGKPSFDLDAWIAKHALPVVSTGSWSGGRKWVLNPCPWNLEHTNRSAYIVQLDNGAISAGCHHNGCANESWQSLRDMLEPGWRTRGRSGRALEPGRGVIRVG